MAPASRAAAIECGQELPGRAWAARAPSWIGDLTLDPTLPRAQLAAEPVGALFVDQHLVAERADALHLLAANVGEQQFHRTLRLAALEADPNGLRRDVDVRPP